MAVSACFGSPMLNFLLGVGFSSTYAILGQKGAPFQLDISDTVLVSGIWIILALVFSLVWIACNGFRAGRVYGGIMVGLYVLVMTTSVAVDVRGTKID